MKYKDLRDFLDMLEQRGQLKRISQEIDPYLEMTEICDRTLRAQGPALLFENPKGFDIPVLEAVGFSATVQTAVPEVKKRVDYIIQGKPGFGAVREVVDAVRYAQKIGPYLDRSL